MNAPLVDSAGADDAVLDPLKARHLPIDGLLDLLATTIVACDNGRVVGCAAVERQALR